jgi:ectoine hydroxylase
MAMTVARSTDAELGRALDDLEREGYAILPGALSREATARFARVVDSLHAAAAERGALTADGSMHLLEPLRTTPALAPLATHPGVLALVASALGWNIHVYHSHADVHPPLRAAPRPAWRWHQDGAVRTSSSRPTRGRGSRSRSRTS